MTDTNGRNAWMVAGAVSLVLFGVYLAMLPNQLTWANFGGDGGDFLAAILSGGIPHPSGYPTYVLLGKLFQLLPWNTPYARGALFSATAMAAAGGLLAAWYVAFAANHPRPWLAGGLAGLAWGLAPLVWSQAVIVEVHGLQALFCVVWLWWIARLMRGDRGAGMYLLALAAGLSLGNHLTVLLLAPAAAWAMWKVHRGGVPWRDLAIQAICAAVGLLVYLYLPLAARHYPPVNWGNPQHWTGFWWTVSGAPYSGLLFNTAAPDLLGRISAWARYLIEQFGVPGLLLGTLGAVQSGLRKPAQALLLWTFTSFSLFAVGYATSDSMLYLIPTYLAGAVWLAQGAAMAWPLRWRSLPVGMAAVMAAIVYLLVRLPSTVRQVNPRDYTAQAYAESLLAEAPEGAILLARRDADTFPLWYTVYGLGMRPDTRIVVPALGQFDWYRETLGRVYPELVLPPADTPGGQTWATALAGLNPGKPLCETAVDTEAIPMVSYGCR